MAPALRLRPAVRAARARAAGDGERPRDPEAGSAVAETVLVTALFVTLAMALLQVCFAVYLRNSLLQCAVEGARYGGRADVSADEGAGRAAELAAGFLGGRRRDAVTATTTVVGGVQVVEVTIRADLPVVGAFGPSGGLTVRGRAFEESQR